MLGLWVQGSVDLGAAPGSWTELLAARSKIVIAVDPAALSEQCGALRNVCHVKKTSENAVGDVIEALGGLPLDLIVCDMVQHPRYCAACLKPLLKVLRPGGRIIMTCKFFGQARDRCAAFVCDFSSSPINPSLLV
jgi:23S rRNA U2552 (ribose-2'-O)-methylase RlmE/FtsJ